MSDASGAEQERSKEKDSLVRGDLTRRQQQEQHRRQHQRSLVASPSLSSDEMDLAVASYTPTTAVPDSVLSGLQKASSSWEEVEDGRAMFNPHHGLPRRGGDEEEEDKFYGDEFSGQSPTGEVRRNWRTILPTQ